MLWDKNIQLQFNNENLENWEKSKIGRNESRRPEFDELKSATLKIFAKKISVLSFGTFTHFGDFVSSQIRIFVWFENCGISPYH